MYKTAMQKKIWINTGISYIAGQVVGKCKDGWYIINTVRYGVAEVPPHLVIPRK